MKVFKCLPTTLTVCVCSAGGIKLGSAVKGCTRGLENYVIFFLQTQSTFSCSWVEFSGFLNYTPVDIIIGPFILQFPYVCWECGSVCVSIVEASCVAIKSFLKRILCESCVCFYVVVSIHHCCFVNYGLCCLTISIQRAREVSAVAVSRHFCLWVVFCLLHLTVVCGYLSLDVWHAPVWQFYSVSVDNFSQGVGGGETFVWKIVLLYCFVHWVSRVGWNM